MSKKIKQHKQTVMGTFTLPNGSIASGILKINGEKTLLKLHLEETMPDDLDFTITGITSAGNYITLDKCGYRNQKRHITTEGKSWYEAEIYTHEIIIGRRHYSSSSDRIGIVSFTSRDLSQAFYDDRAFGSIHSSEPLMDVLKSELPSGTEMGEWPHVLFYSGKSCIFEAQTDIGKVTVGHRPTIHSTNIRGLRASNKLTMEITLNKPASAKACYDIINQVGIFIAYITGNPVDIKSFEMELFKEPNEKNGYMTYIPVYGWIKPKRPVKSYHWRDTPINLIQDKESYPLIFCRWMALHGERKAARIRFIGCLSKGNSYDIDRIVAAANMFDILPDSAFPRPEKMCPNLSTTRAAASDLFRKLPHSIDRDGALSALGRLGKPSLPKKVIHRAQIIIQAAGDRFPALETVAGLAVKLRNFYVHDSEINYQAIEPYQVFLIDTLEFIFGASELIECGWEINEWFERGHSAQHNFSNYILGYRHLADSLLKALEIKTHS